MLISKIEKLYEFKLWRSKFNGKNTFREIGARN